jgi:hypothetical protein
MDTVAYHYRPIAEIGETCDGPGCTAPATIETARDYDGAYNTFCSKACADRTL